LSPRFNGYDDSDSDIFEGMEDRKYSMDAGIGLGYEIDDWKFQLSSLHDVLDRSDGNEIIASIGKVYRTGPVFIEPAIGLSYLDSKLVDYYYGVEASEATPDRPEFAGDSALNTTLGVSFITPVFFDGLTRLGIQNTWFDDSITDSPLTDSDAGLEYFIAFSKFF
jgi:outer membrane protein